MSYYHDLITQKSWEELKRLRQRIHFILIGGWAAYLYTKALKSKDIDVIVNFDQLPVFQKYYRLVKNDRLKKYEAIFEEVQIDIYLPHYSDLGIPVSILQQHAQALEGFTLLDPNYLLALKIYALSQRARTAKGEKDFIDVAALVNCGRADLASVKDLLVSHALKQTFSVLISLFSEHTDIPELGIARHAYAKLRKKVTASFGG